jgi:hypothetical protein
MKLGEILTESLSVSQIKIEDIAEGTFRVKADSTSGPIVQVIKSIAFLEFYSSWMDHIDEDEEEKHYVDYSTACKKVVKKLKVMTLAGKEIDKTMPWDSFKSNGVLLQGDKKDVEFIIKSAIEFENAKDEWKKAEKAEYEKTKDDRKKSASQASAKNRKALEDKYGKKTLSRVTIKQIGGDDGYQWNVIVDGRSIMNGLTKREADYEKEKAWQRLSKKDKVGTYGAEK